MRLRTISTFSAIPSALFLLVIGIVHSVVNFSDLWSDLGNADADVPELGFAKRLSSR